MSASDNCKDGASTSRSNNDGVCDVNNMLNSMNLANDEKNIGIERCANCGKEGNDDMNICNKCKQVKYCNASCKKKNRHKHKNDCEEYVRLAAEHAAKLHDIELFKQPPSQYEDCPICFLKMPSFGTGRRYNSCCGKIICSGCAYAPLYDGQGNKIAEEKCPFCRTPKPKTNEEAIIRMSKRVEAGDPLAIGTLASYYGEGKYEYPQDHAKAFELFHRAGDLGDSEGYCCIGCAYDQGLGVEVDKKKAVQYFELAAMGGNGRARYNLGSIINSNMNRALRHHMIAIRSGYVKSLEKIKLWYTHGYVTKDVYMAALQTYQVYLGEIKSPQRDEAAAADENCRYY